MSSTLFGWLIHGIRPHADATNTDQKWPSYRSGSRISILVLSATSSIRGRIFCTNAQFGLASLWRKAKNGVHSANCQGPSVRSISDRLGLWQIIHALGSNTKSWLETSKMLTSTDGDLTLCYMLRRLGANIQEPYIQNSCPTANRCFYPVVEKQAGLLPCASPGYSQRIWPSSSIPFFAVGIFKSCPRRSHATIPRNYKTIFVKHRSVMDLLCNHKHTIQEWSQGTAPSCCCQTWQPYRSACLNPSEYRVLSGSLFASMLPAGTLTEGTLMNKVFPSKKESCRCSSLASTNGLAPMAFPPWRRRPSVVVVSTCWSHQQPHYQKKQPWTLQSPFQGAIFHCEDKPSSSLQIYCPCLLHEAMTRPSPIKMSLNRSPTLQTPSSTVLFKAWESVLVAATPGLLDVAETHLQVTSWPKQRQTTRAVVLSYPSWTHPSGQWKHFGKVDISTYSLQHFATGDAHALLKILREAPDPRWSGALSAPGKFYYKLEPFRFVGALYMLLDFLLPVMDLSNTQAFSVQPGGLVRGRTFRTWSLYRRYLRWSLQH